MGHRDFFLARNWKFESISLQRGVSCEPNFRGRIPPMTVGDLTYASARQEADAGPASGHRQDRSLGGPLPTAFTRPDPSCRSPTRQR
jgi:hypothetical protein